MIDTRMVSFTHPVKPCSFIALSVPVCIPIGAVYPIALGITPVLVVISGSGAIGLTGGVAHVT
jgi:hypothetical protein